MKSLLLRGIVPGLLLVVGTSANGQSQNAAASRSEVLPATPSPHSAPENSTYNYDFITQRYVWSNKPLKSTAGKICKTMKDHAFSETAYAINDDKDWNSCLDTQIQSIGYMRWLQNDYGFKANSRNRKQTRTFLQKNYTMGPWGSYSFAQLRDAVKAVTGPQ